MSTLEEMKADSRIEEAWKRGIDVDPNYAGFGSKDDPATDQKPDKPQRVRWDPEPGSD